MFIDGLPQKMDVPCRKCVGCRYDRSVEWSVRAFHEFKTNDEMASFITLTYSDDFYLCFIVSLVILLLMGIFQSDTYSYF